MSLKNPALVKKRINEYKKVITDDLDNLIGALVSKNKFRQGLDYESLKNHIDDISKYLPDKNNDHQALKKRLDNLKKHLEENNSKLSNQEINGIRNIISIL